VAWVHVRGKWTHAKSHFWKAHSTYILFIAFVALYNADICRFSLKSSRLGPRSWKMDPRKVPFLKSFSTYILFIAFLAFYHADICRFSLKSSRLGPRSWEMDPRKVPFLNRFFYIYSFYSFPSLIPREHPPNYIEIKSRGTTFMIYGYTQSRIFEKLFLHIFFL
jgi:hypothetical protein